MLGWDGQMDMHVHVHNMLPCAHVHASDIDILLTSEWGKGFHALLK